MTVEGWRSATLGDVVVEILGGGTPDRRNPAFWNGKIPWASVKDLCSPLRTGTEEAITESGLAASSARLVPAGTVVVGTRMAPGRAVRFAIDVAINQDLKAIFPAKALSTDFLHQWLRAREEDIAARASGSTVKGIRLETLRAVPFLLPPLPEQRKIATILSSVDDTIEASQAVIDHLQVVKKAMMAELLTKGLPGRHKKFKQTEIGQVPDEWEVFPLAACTARVTDGTHQTPIFEKSGVPFLLVKSISSGRVRWSEGKFVSEKTYRELTKSWIPRRGDVLYTAVGATYGVAVSVDFDSPFTFQRHIAHIRPDASRLSSTFLTWFLNSPMGRKQADLAAVGNAQPTVTLGSLSRFSIPLPSLREQGEISEVLGCVDKRVLAEESVREHHLQVKSALLSVLLTGEVRVRVDKDAAA
jgi:type I restriction enzyme S subunit